MWIRMKWHKGFILGSRLIDLLLHLICPVQARAPIIFQINLSCTLLQDSVTS